ncbi:MAG: hypothetical protein WCB04_00355, partial [Mycobacteriales bacterium]
MSHSPLSVRIRARATARPPLPAPDDRQLRRALTRAAAAGACYAFAAVVLHRSGYPNQGAYALMALSMVPQVMMLARAMSDPSRRKDLRISRRPMLLHAAISLVLTVMAVTVLL